MNGYVCFYRSKRIEVYAETSYKAQCDAARRLGVSDKNRYKISVTLAETSDKRQVVHVADF